MVENPIRLLLADDQDLIRDALATLLDLETDLRVVAQAGRGDEAVSLVTSQPVDVALLDIEMPGGGIEAAAQIRRASPDTRVLIVTTFGRPGYLKRALQAGANGFVVKDAPATRLTDAVRRVYQGLRVVDPDLAAVSLAAGDSPLTERETDVLQTARAGSTVADIAKHVFLSEGTVRNYLSSAMSKTGAHTRAEAVRAAEENGWL